MSKLEFGWRMQTFSIDGTPGALLVEQVEEHLRRLDGHVRAVWVQDHLMPENPWTPPAWDSLEAWSTLAHWAAAFPAYHFGTIVLANSYRSPALLAKMAATTQLLTHGLMIGHIAPEAALGGPIAIVAEGDEIVIDVDRGALDLMVSADEIARRFESWAAPEPRYRGGVMAKYAALVGSASQGAVTTGPRMTANLRSAR